MDAKIYKLAVINTLKQMRLDSQLTQKQLADLIHKPQSFVSKYENGERELEFFTVLHVCFVLNKQLAEFEEILNSYIMESDN